jgi:hypothetical protein
LRLPDAGTRPRVLFLVAHQLPRGLDERLGCVGTMHTSSRFPILGVSFSLRTSVTVANRPRSTLHGYVVGDMWSKYEAHTSVLSCRDASPGVVVPIPKILSMYSVFVLTSFQMMLQLLLSFTAATAVGMSS